MRGRVARADAELQVVPGEIAVATCTFVEPAKTHKLRPWAWASAGGGKVPAGGATTAAASTAAGGAGVDGGASARTGAGADATRSVDEPAGGWPDHHQTTPESRSTESATPSRAQVHTGSRGAAGAARCTLAVGGERRAMPVGSRRRICPVGGCSTGPRRSSTRAMR